MNPLVAAVRTVVQALVSIAVIAVGNYTLTTLGVELDVEAIAQYVSVGALGLLVLGFNWLGAQFPIVNTVLSLGLSTGSAAYEA